MQVPQVESVQATTTPAHAAPKRSFLYYRNATFLSLLFGYMGYYLCRQNFSAAYAPMHDDLGIDEVTFGTIASVGTALYAVGKIVSGPAADLLGGRRVFLFGLFASAAVSLVFGLAVGVPVFIALWSANRLFQSFGWSGIVNVMPRWFEKRQYGTAMGAISTSYQFGGVFASLFAAFVLSLGLGWRGLFLVPALTLVAVGLLAMGFLRQRPEDVGHVLPLEPDASSHLVDDHGRPEFLRLLTTPRFLIVCGLSFVLTLLREVFGLWMPAYFASMGASAHQAAFKATVFPLLGCVGTLFAGYVSDRYLKSNRGLVIFVFLVGLLLSLLGLANVETLAPSLGLEKSQAALAFVGLTGFFILGPYSMVGGGVVALDFGGKKTAATAAGLLDGVGYVGATLAGVGIAKIVAEHGWSTAYAGLVALSALSLVLSLSLFKTPTNQRG